MNSLLVAQKSIIKVALHKPKRFPTKELFQVFNIRQLFIKNILIFINKSKSSIFSLTGHDYSNRHRENISISVALGLKNI
jgi:hypothetical protein